MNKVDELKRKLGIVMGMIDPDLYEPYEWYQALKEFEALLNEVEK
jgi:hypothetical protein